MFSPKAQWRKQEERHCSFRGASIKNADELQRVVEAIYWPPMETQVPATVLPKSRTSEGYWVNQNGKTVKWFSQLMSHSTVLAPCVFALLHYISVSLWELWQWWLTGSYQQWISLYEPLCACVTTWLTSLAPLNFTWPTLNTTVNHLL